MQEQAYLKHVAVAVVAVVQLLQAAPQSSSSAGELLLSAGLHCRHLPLHPQQALCPPCHHVLHCHSAQPC